MATILIVDDDAGLRDGLVETIDDLGHRPQTAATGHAALSQLAAGGVDAVLLDLRLPGGLDDIEVLRRIRMHPDTPPVAVLTAFASADNTIEAMRLGAFDHLTKPIGREDLKALLGRMLARHEPAGVRSVTVQVSASVLVGASDGMRRVQKLIGMAADSDAAVLIRGETGTGKELVARALHQHGRRKAKPFVAVNCAAIPAELLESELFGHVRGAFTGAGADRQGAFREADGGTLFLDEIGDMPLAMQAKILRALQERVVTPVGGKSAAVDVRIVAATHRDLESLVVSGAFRADLLYRLNVLPIALPPLRERLADILPLAEHFLDLAARDAAPDGAPKRLTAAAASRLLAWPWPGNIRELRNVMERASVLVRGPVIDAGDIRLDQSRHDDCASLPPQWLNADLPTAIARLERAMILHALDACGGNRAEAARRLNINRQLLYTKMQRYGIGGQPSPGPTPGVGKTDADADAH